MIGTLFTSLSNIAILLHTPGCEYDCYFLWISHIFSHFNTLYMAFQVSCGFTSGPLYFFSHWELSSFPPSNSKLWIKITHAFVDRIEQSQVYPNPLRADCIITEREILYIFKIERHPKEKKEHVKQTPSKFTI